MSRLFKASPGWLSKKRNSSYRHQKKNRSKYDSYKLLNSDNREETTNDETKKALPWESQHVLKFDSSKYSREERKLPKFKTLDDGSIDMKDEDVQKVLNSNPRMKRSKTPSTYYKPHKIQYQSKAMPEPKNYYANIIKNDSGINFRERSSQGTTHYNPSSMLISRFTKMSSHTKIQSLKESVLLPTEDSNFILLYKIKGKCIDTNSDEIQKPNIHKRRRSIITPEAFDKIGDIVIMRTDKNFIIKVKNVRIAKKGGGSMSIQDTSDYSEQVKNTIIMSIKQGMKLLIDNDNNYRNICDKLYYKFGRLMIS